MKKKLVKLDVRRETLRNLDQEGLAALVGGATHNNCCSSHCWYQPPETECCDTQHYC